MTEAPATVTLPWADDFTDEALDTGVATGLGAVEALLWESLQHEQPLLNESSRHLVKAGGKRFRPMLALLSTYCCGDRNDQVVAGATACEIVHLATLYHDDVMDEAKLRRGAQSANARWDNNVAIITGDFLFAVAAKMIADLGEYVMEVHHDTSRRLVSGQIREMVRWSPGLTAEAHYMKLISDKTASLINASCRIGGHLGGGSAGEVEVLGTFAEELGLAFQLSDDVLDVVGGPALGKPVGGDLREGVPTLPTVFVRANPGPGDARLVELLGQDLSLDDAAHAEAVALLRAHEALRECRDRVRVHVDRAVRVLDELPGSPARQALRCVARTMETRVS